MSIQATPTCFSAHGYPACGLFIRMVHVEGRVMFVVRRSADATSACQIEFGGADQGLGGVRVPR